MTPQKQLECVERSGGFEPDAPPSPRQGQGIRRSRIALAHLGRDACCAGTGPGTADRASVDANAVAAELSSRLVTLGA
jgi:hypothetical protein